MSDYYYVDQVKQLARECGVPVQLETSHNIWFGWDDTNNEYQTYFRLWIVFMPLEKQKNYLVNQGKFIRIKYDDIFHDSLYERINRFKFFIRKLHSLKILASTCPHLPCSNFNAKSCTNYKPKGD